MLPAAVALVAACSGDGGGPGTTPFEATACSLYWYRARTGGRFDLYKVEMPADGWTPGVRTFDGVSRLGVFYYGLLDGDGDGLFEQWLDAASATSGDFTVGGGGLDDGDAVTFDDASAQGYLGLGNVLLATGGTGSFDGVWSPHSLEDGEGEPVYAEDANVTIAYAGSSLALGSDAYVAFGRCWSDPMAAANAVRGVPAERLWRPTPKTH